MQTKVLFLTEAYGKSLVSSTLNVTKQYLRRNKKLTPRESE